MNSFNWVFLFNVNEKKMRENFGFSAINRVGAKMPYFLTRSNIDEILSSIDAAACW